MCRQRTIEVSVKALGGGLTNPCQSCGVREAEYSCSECHGMTYCAVCNDTWHVNNPIRQGHPYVEICRDTTGEVQKNTYIEPDSGVQLSPEKLKMSLLQQLTLQGRIGLIAIDEAHLIFDWQTLRSKHARIESIKQDFPSIPLWFSQLQPLQKFYST